MAISSVTPAAYRPTAQVARETETAAPLTKTSRFYRPELDALRFFAFFAVFLAHAVAVNEKTGVLHSHPALAHGIAFLHHAGAFGLSLFFFLSAFLITTLLMLERQKTQTINLRSFYVRRILRIWPLYFAYMGAAFALGTIWEPAHFSVHALATYFTLSANWYVIVAGTLTPAVMFLWSISVEEQFYLLWPAMVRSLSTRGIRNFCIALLVLSLVGIATLAATRSSAFNIWFNSVTEMLFFASGGLLALWLGLEQQTKSWGKCIGGAAICLAAWLVANAAVNTNSQNDPITVFRALSGYILIAVGTASLLWAFLHMPRRLVLPQLVYLGRISYGLYVFHGMAILVGEHILGPHMRGGLWLLPTFALTVMAAMLSYEFFEKPFLKLKHRFELVHSRAA